MDTPNARQRAALELLAHRDGVWPWCRVDGRTARALERLGLARIRRDATGVQARLTDHGATRCRELGLYR